MTIDVSAYDDERLARARRLGRRAGAAAARASSSPASVWRTQGAAWAGCTAMTRASRRREHGAGRRRARHHHAAYPDGAGGGRHDAAEGSRRGRRAAGARGVEAAARPSAQARVRLEARNGREAIALIRERNAQSRAARRADAANGRLRRRPRDRSGAHAGGDLRDRARPVCDPRVRDRRDRLPAQAGHRGALCARVRASVQPDPRRSRTTRRRDRSWRCSTPIANPPRQLDAIRGSIRRADDLRAGRRRGLDRSLPELRPAAHRPDGRICCTCR